MSLYSNQQNPNDDKIRHLQYMSELTEREQALTKLQTALLVKEKLIRNDMKMLSARQTSLEKQASVNNEDRGAVESIWQDVLERIDLDHSFRRNIFEKCN